MGTERYGCNHENRQYYNILLISTIEQSAGGVTICMQQCLDDTIFLSSSLSLRI